MTAEFTGDIIKNASQIGDMADSFSATQADQRNPSNGSSPTNAEQMAAFAKTISLMSDMNEPGKGALFQVAGGANFKFSKVAYTAGTGINLLFTHFDVSAVVSSEKTQLDDKDIPTKVGVAASFGLLF